MPDFLRPPRGFTDGWFPSAWVGSSGGGAWWRREGRQGCLWHDKFVCDTTSLFVTRHVWFKKFFIQDNSFVSLFCLDTTRLTVCDTASLFVTQICLWHKSDCLWHKFDCLWHDKFDCFVTQVILSVTQVWLWHDKSDCLWHRFDCDTTSLTVYDTGLTVTRQVWLFMTQVWLWHDKFDCLWHRFDCDTTLLTVTRHFWLWHDTFDCDTTRLTVTRQVWRCSLCISVVRERNNVCRLVLCSLVITAVTEKSMLYPWALLLD